MEIMLVLLKQFVDCVEKNYLEITVLSMLRRRTLLRQIQRTRLQKLKYYHLKERGHLIKYQGSVTGFESSHLRMWQTYNIDEGKLVTLKSTKNSVQLKVFNDWTEMSFNDLITEGTEQASKQQKQTFICSMDGCIEEFKNQISLDQHLLQGSCEYKLEKGPLKDQAKDLYAQKLSNNVHHCPDMQAVLLENACTADLSAKEM
ncbi:unnamed protein product [Mytilus coruscus]|uniref:Uncharacterized protein n=1 Tax=Mytilus coruscus TaxID=42192 RepID=A0A6J8CMH9_MYTCO|nr:unnamed protein product [Mytilus coruscus]